MFVLFYVKRLARDQIPVYLVYLVLPTVC